jgi:hypothetical protein
MSKMASLKKTLSKSFVENHESIDEDAASQLIIASEQKIRSIKEERAADEKLAAAKQITKDLNSAYTAALKYEQAKIDFLVEKINEIQSGEVNPSSGANQS